jgi:hypothetical protein
LVFFIAVNKPPIKRLLKITQKLIKRLMKRVKPMGDKGLKKTIKRLFSYKILFISFYENLKLFNAVFVYVCIRELVNMDSNKIISSLCYFSIFFAGFLLPIAVYFIVPDHEVRDHAKKAFISHLIPFITVIFFIIPMFFIGSMEAAVGGMFILFVLFSVISLIVLIWNVVKGIQVLAK